MGVAANSEVPGRDPEMSVTPVPAATVILLRDSANGPETLLLERHARSEFLPDMYVFPGGRVEARDQALAGRLAGLEPEAAAALLPSVPAALAHGFFVAASRETFEEAGIQLARSRAPRFCSPLPPTKCKKIFAARSRAPRFTSNSENF